ncbi:MAG: TetR/AcrR family transcriptional regulator [Longispora sp.]|nr:TetR/AcrR family transcriptional regulator [Longispora sp. (in: high G+C Gram-positive bacteria)]
MTRRTGRRPGKQDTREAILAAAREVFAEHGYDGASIRQIATGAEVDPALVHHYFGTKKKLFYEVLRPPIDPGEMLPKVLDGAPSQLGERIVRTFLSIWEEPQTRPAFEAMVRAAVANTITARLVQEFFTSQIQRRLQDALSEEVPREELPLRTSLAASQLFGLALARYILAIEPLASASRETVVAIVAPTIDRYLRQPLPQLTVTY